VWRIKSGSCFRHIRKEPDLPRQLQDDPMTGECRTSCDASQCQNHQNPALHPGRLVTLHRLLQALSNSSIYDMAGGSTFTWQHALRLHSSLSPFESPVPVTHPAFRDVKPISWKRMNIGGLLTTIYGLQELPPDVTEVTAMWLLHGRGGYSHCSATSLALTGVLRRYSR